MATKTTETEIDRKDVNDSAPEDKRRPRSVGGLALGLPDHWYPIMRASDLCNAPVRLKRFGEHLAVWRDSAGNPRVFQDRSMSPSLVTDATSLLGTTIRSNFFQTPKLAARWTNSWLERPSWPSSWTSAS